MLSLTAFLLSSVICFLIYYLFFRNDGNTYPDGPFALPLVGNLLQLRGGQHKQFVKWSKEYGPICQVKLGPNRCYILSDLKTIREVFNDPNCNDRPYNEAFALLRDGPHGVVSSSGQEWSEQRRFTLRHLRDFGFGKMAGEDMIAAEVTEFLSNFAKDAGKPVVVSRTFNTAVLNTLWTITTGNRYPQDDPRLWGIFHQLKKFQEQAGRNPAAFFVPSFARAFPRLLGWNVVVKMINDIKKVLQDHVDEHQKTFSANSVPRDFMDVYLAEIYKTTDKRSSFYKENGVRSLKAVMADFFIAGSETVTLTLSWSVLYLSKFTDVQRKLQAELDKVVGRNRNPHLADRPSLPYTEATITEVLRYSSIVPIGLFHEVKKDSKILGFDCLKGTQIAANLFYIHHDERHFPEPEKFKPERYLSMDGKSFKKSDALMPFGHGKRACLGETLARDEVFLFMTSMFHRFSIRLADESKDVSLEPIPGFIMGPQDYKVVMMERD